MNEPRPQSSGPVISEKKEKDLFKKEFQEYYEKFQKEDWITPKEIKQMSDFKKKMNEGVAEPFIDWSSLFYLGLGLALLGKGVSFLAR